MSCEEIKNLLDEYITGELDEQERGEVEGHLVGCADCRRELDELRTIKGELSKLAQDVPSGFDERLSAKIKKQKRSVFFSITGIGASAAAAAVVVLICLIGIGHGYDSSEHLEDRLEAARENGNAVTESAAVAGVSEEEDVAAQEETQTIAEAATESDTKLLTQAAAEPTSGKTTYLYIEETEIQTQAAEVQTAVNTVKPLEETTMSVECEAEEEKTAGADKAAVNQGAEKYSFEMDAADEEAAETDSAPRLKSAALGSNEQAEEYGVNLIINSADVKKVEEILASCEAVAEFTSGSDGIRAFVGGISYAEFKAKLDGIEVTEESIYIEETDEYYSVKFTTK